MNGEPIGSCEQCAMTIIRLITEIVSPIFFAEHLEPDGNHEHLKFYRTFGGKNRIKLLAILPNLWK